MSTRRRKLDDVHRCADFINGRIVAYFPLRSVNGWQYRGFGINSVDGVAFCVLRFERNISGRLAYALLEVAAASFDPNLFDLKSWIVGELERHTIKLAIDHSQQTTLH